MNIGCEGQIQKYKQNKEIKGSCVCVYFNLDINNEGEW